MKLFMCLLAVIVAVSLGLNVGSRIPAQAAAMGIGMLLGILATVPVSLTMLLLLHRGQPKSAPPVEMPRPFSTQPPYPLVDGYRSDYQFPSLVVINPSAFERAQLVRPPARVENLPLISPQREFRVIGGEGE